MANFNIFDGVTCGKCKRPFKVGATVRNTDSYDEMAVCLECLPSMLNKVADFGGYHVATIQMFGRDYEKVVDDWKDGIY
jgi:hypothetical protein